MSQLRAVPKPPEIPGLMWVRLLGSGGLADVHSYRQALPSRNVAVKVLRDSDEISRANLAREADALARVSGHPAIVGLYSAGVTSDGRNYLVMEWCPVADLQAQVRHQPMAVPRALDLMIRIAGGVEVLHRVGIIHADIKPSNIMLTEYGHPVLGDFGLATPVGLQMPRGEAGFSVFWAPPEQQIAGAPVQATHDVWALGATLWTLLAGRAPFEDTLGDNSIAAVAPRVRSGRIPGIGRPDVPPELERALARSMAVDPAARTPSALRFALDLADVQQWMHLPVTVPDVRVEDPGATAIAADTDRTRASIQVIEAAEPTRASIPVIETAEPTRAQLREVRARGAVSAADGQQAAGTWASQAPGSQAPGSQPQASQPQGSQPPVPQAQASQAHGSQPQASQPPVPQAQASQAQGSQPPASHERTSQAQPAQPLGPQPSASQLPTSQPPAPQSSPSHPQLSHPPVAAPVADAERRPRKWAYALLSLVGVAVCVGAVLGVLTSNGYQFRPAEPPVASVQPADPVDAPIAPVRELTGAREGDRVHWSWRYDLPKGMRFVYTITADGAPGEPEETTLSSVVVPAASGQMCIEVRAVKTDGRQSPPQRDCR